MSASREKKQRQGAGPDPKATRAQQEQAAHKRQTVIYAVTAAVIALLVIALLVWRSGFFQSRAAAATVGGETLTTAELSFYYHGVRSSYANPYLSASLGFDTTKSDEDQFYNEAEGVTFRDYFLETALTNAKQFLALADEAIKQGHTEAEIKDTLDATIKSVKDEAASYGYSYTSYLRSVYGPYMSTSVYESLTARTLLARLAASDKANELYDGFSQSDLDAFYQENVDQLDTIEYSFLYFAIPSINTKDDEGNEIPEDELQKLKDEVQANAKQSAEEALAELREGEAVSHLKEHFNPTSSGDHIKTVGTGAINTAYSQQLLALDKEASELVETDGGYYVIAFHDRYRNEEPTRDVRHIVILADTTTDEDGHTAAPTDEAWAAAKEKIDAIQAEYEAGAKTEDAFAALANEKSDDGDGTTGGLYSRIASTNTSLVPEFLSWIFEDGRSVGDVGIVQHSAGENDGNKYWGYHLMYYVGENEPVWMGSARESLTNQGQQTWIDELSAGYSTALAGGADYLGK